MQLPDGKVNPPTPALPEPVGSSGSGRGEQSLAAGTVALSSALPARSLLSHPLCAQKLFREHGKANANWNKCAWIWSSVFFGFFSFCLPPFLVSRLTCAWTWHKPDRCG